MYSRGWHSNRLYYEVQLWLQFKSRVKQIIQQVKGHSDDKGPVGQEPAKQIPQSILM